MSWVHEMSYEERERKMNTAPCGPNGLEGSASVCLACPYKWECPFEEEYDEWDDTPGDRMGIDYSPSNPWDAPGMSIWDFI